DVGRRRGQLGQGLVGIAGGGDDLEPLDQLEEVAEGFPYDGMVVDDHHPHGRGQDCLRPPVEPHAVLRLADLHKFYAGARAAGYGVPLPLARWGEDSGWGTCPRVSWSPAGWRPWC